MIILDSIAVTRIQSLILVTIIVVAVVAGSLAYVLLSSQTTSKTIKIGVTFDLDTTGGRNFLQGAVLAAEQLNAEGGILGRQIEVVGEDNDITTGVDPAKIKSALTRLLTYHKVDLVIGVGGSEGYMVQEVLAEHKKIFFEAIGTQDEFTQRVLDDYDNYKYYFRNCKNATSTLQGITDGLKLLREQTGFNKVGYLGQDVGLWHDVMEGLDYVLPELGFDLVYKQAFPLGTVDFTSYFAAAEAAEVEIMIPLIVTSGVFPFIQEYHERQSPMVVYGIAGGGGIVDWESTGGKCEYISNDASPVVAGYPLTSKTLPFREKYIDRWGEINELAARSYDILRYILPDAIERAETIEVEAVIQALETTSIETTSAENFVFTSSHDLMVGENPNNPDADYSLVFYFQWIDEKQVPVYPKKIMEESGATYTFPDWSGPWD